MSTFEIFSFVSKTFEVEELLSDVEDLAEFIDVELKSSNCHCNKVIGDHQEAFQDIDIGKDVEALKYQPLVWLEVISEDEGGVSSNLRQVIELTQFQETALSHGGHDVIHQLL